MLKNILKLNGAQKLEKNEQKSISGGLGDPFASVCNNYPNFIWSDVKKCCLVRYTNCCEGDAVCLS